MLITPQPSGSKAILADWLEFRAILAGNASFSELPRAWEEEFGDEEDDNIERLNEETPNIIFEEIKKRIQFLSESYPFTLTDLGIALKEPLTEEQASYLLCLHLSIAETQLTDYEITSEERRLFQLISTIASSGYFCANSIWFGFPRPDRSGFFDAIKNAFEDKIREGKVHEFPLIGSNISIKDGEIDIITYKEMNDNLPGKLFFYGQVASGCNYDQKELSKNQIEYIFSLFKIPPSKEYIRGIFIPFCPWHQVEHKNGIEALKIRIQQESIRFGLIFSRYRIPFYIYQVLERKRNNILSDKIDGLNEISLLTAWANNFIAHVRQDHS